MWIKFYFYVVQHRVINFLYFIRIYQMLLAQKYLKKWTAEKQSKRANPQVSTIDKYHKVTVFMPYVDKIVIKILIQNYYSIFKQ